MDNLNRFTEISGSLTSVKGISTAAVNCGLKKEKDKRDLVLIYSEKEAVAAGVFTTNLFCAAPVMLSKSHLASSKSKAQAIIVNSGNANACTGEAGLENARKTAKLTAEALGTVIIQPPLSPVLDAGC